MDLLIAASALVDEAPLVTRNLEHFTRVPGAQSYTVGASAKGFSSALRP
jgi:predicted nucleic acid-binding protein